MAYDPRVQPRARNWRELLHPQSTVLITLAYALVAVAYTWPTLPRFFTDIAGRGQDGFQNLWNMWWFRVALFSGQSPYQTKLLFYPDGTGLYLHTLNPYNALVSIPLQPIMSLGAIYNLLALAAIVIGGLGMYRLASDVLAAADLPTTGPAFLAGLIYACSPYFFAHLSIGHLNLISTEWLPWYVWALGRAVAFFSPPVPPRLRSSIVNRNPTAQNSNLKTPSHSTFNFRYVILAALFFILTALCDLQYALYLAIFSPLYVGYALWQRRNWWVLVNAAAVALLAAAPITPLVMGASAEAQSGKFLVPPLTDTVRLSADLAAFVTPTTMQPFWGSDPIWLDKTFTAGYGDSQVYLGYTVLLLAIVGLVRLWRRAWFWGLLAAAFLFTSLGPVLHIYGKEIIGLPYFLNKIGFLSSYRAPIRFVLLAMLCLGVAAALGVAALARGGKRRGRVIVGLAIALVLLEYLPVPFPTVSTSVSPFYTQMRFDRQDYAVVELPISFLQGRYDYAQTVHGKPLLGGYISRPPTHYAMTADVPPFRDLFWLDALAPDIVDYDLARVGPSALQYYKIGYLLVHPAKFSGARAVALNRILAAIAQPTTVYSDSELTAYLPKESSGAPFITLGSGWGDVFGGPKEGDGSSPPQRATSGLATLEIIAVQATTTTLRLSLQSPALATTATLDLDGTRIYTASVDSNGTTLTVPLQLKAGVHSLTLDGAGRPLLASHISVSP